MERVKIECGRREARKQDRRRAIITAARQLFLDHGYAGASMSDLLKVLGGSKATLWSYFRCKEELFAAVIEDVSSNFRAEMSVELAQAGDLASGVRAFCRALLTRMDDPAALETWRLIAAESGRFPEVGRIFVERATAPTEATLAGFLASHAGDLREGDTMCMARTLIGFCHARQHRLLWGVETSDAARVEADANLFAELFLRCYARGPETLTASRS